MPHGHALHAPANTGFSAAIVSDTTGPFACPGRCPGPEAAKKEIARTII
jgi:hypothetical protein